MKNRSYLFVLITLLLAALSCSLPGMQAEETPPPAHIEENSMTDTAASIPSETPQIDTPTETPDQEPFACGPGLAAANAYSVEFCYPEQYSSGFMQLRVSENLPSDELPLWGVHPEMIEIDLTGYPVDNRYHKPIVWIYPVADLVAFDPVFQNIINDLITLLNNQDPNPENIPFMPLFNAAQMMQGQVSYLNFQNGQGVRFITQYGQAFLPISNDSTFYAFIGLTEDGDYLISATLPVTHPFFFQGGMTEPEEGWDAFLENFPAYIDKMEADLTAQPPESFFPDLTSLDKMVTSFLIPAGAIP